MESLAQTVQTTLGVMATRLHAKNAPIVLSVMQLTGNAPNALQVKKWIILTELVRNALLLPAPSECSARTAMILA